MMYLYLLLIYKSKGFILLVTIVSLLDFNNTGFSRPKERDLARPELKAWPGLFPFIKIWARPAGHLAYAGL